MTASQIKRYEITELVLPPLTPLQTALLKSGVKILDEENVMTYQREQLDKARAAMLSGTSTEKRPKLRWESNAAGAFAGLLAIATGAYSFMQLKAGIPIPIKFACASGIFLGLLLMAGCLAELALRYDRWCRPERTLLQRAALLKWRTYAVGSCGPAGFSVANPFLAAGVGNISIPDAAVDVARRISRAGAEASFSVDQLDSDPFLWVHSEDEWYCVAVWDEEGFHG